MLSKKIFNLCIGLTSVHMLICSDQNNQKNSLIPINLNPKMQNIEADFLNSLHSYSSPIITRSTTIDHQELEETKKEIVADRIKKALDVLGLDKYAHWREISNQYAFIMGDIKAQHEIRPIKKITLNSENDIIRVTRAYLTLREYLK